MRLAICYMCFVATTLTLMGCGQSGNLQLANDPNYDKRAKYLLHSNTESKVQTGKKQIQAVDAQTSASEAQ